jgi:hypothetical protein
MGTVSFINKKSENVLNESELPWHYTPSIYSHIKDHLNAETGDIAEDGESLPDEERQFGEDQLRWAAGALDGVFGHHGSGAEAQDTAKTIALYVVEIANNDSQQAKIELYNRLCEGNLLGYIDEMVEEIVKAEIYPQPYLHKFAQFLAIRSPDREPVKFAIALLGLIAEPADKETVLLLGKHDEFTLYTTVALSNMLENPEAELWELAKTVHGWGRIQLVERLAAFDNPEIKQWLIREGYRNTVMYEYLAYLCATQGGLKMALSNAVIDDELLTSAGEIIDALIAGGPAEDIDNYEEAAYVLSRYLTHVESKAATLKHLNVAGSILSYLGDEDWDANDRAKNGWNERNRSLTIEQAQRIIDDPKWKAMAESGLASTERTAFYTANRAAKLLQMDTWDIHWQRLQANPDDEGCWFEIMQRANADNIAQITDYAVSIWPLSKVATGAQDELGFGAEYAIHRCLDYILQELGTYPKLGWPLIEAALKSPITRNRNLAIKTLAAWGQQNWNAEIRLALEQAMSVEPKNEVKETIAQLLAGKASL